MRVFAVLALVEIPRGVAVSRDHAWLVAFLVVFSVVVVALVLRGSRVVWVFLVGSEVIGLLLSPWTGWGTWWVVLLGVVETALLLLPPSWRFVWRTVPNEAGVVLAGTSWGVDARPESDRPDGWYVDGDNPRRMRYWRSETGEWLGSGKTPRKLKNRLPVQSARPASDPGQTQTTWEPSSQDDADCPRGWYVDPGNPARMRYWAGEGAGWQGRVKTPQKIRAAWEAESRG